MELNAELRSISPAAPFGRCGGPSFGVGAGGASGAFWVRLDVRIVGDVDIRKQNERFIVDAQPYSHYQYHGSFTALQ